ncbi:hydroxyacylglutathione hydrolase [Legionella impletisoli]|uniref:Hydroxyacylglutathione hydrolase n=1 Tax=Legionella impletisoli TaxID=343510 RepID=A0A917JRS5_9GAMM|nr:hydroxyacylglutathione hydrolase [Legionella impletisoli]GGI80672.1 hydroxyacylglutathione hydrolase [Legionella impletisoli]
MTIVALSALKDNYIWAIINEKNHTFICVDPGDANPLLSYAEKNHLSLTHILITHHHYDHVGGLGPLKEAFPDVRIFGPIDERIPEVNTPVRDEDVIHIDQYDFRVLSIPGHTSTHICYQEPSKGWLFCGDTLFSAGCGRVFDGSMKQLFYSLELLKALPQQTKLFCAHEYTRQNLKFARQVEPENEAIQTYQNHLADESIQCTLPSTIALEKQINPFLRTDKDALKQYAETNGINPDDEFLIFKHLREAKDQFN